MNPYRNIKTITFAITLILMMNHGTVLSNEQPIPKITGTFFQPLNIHKEWQSENWQALFECYRDLNIDTLVLQWTKHDTSYLYKNEPDSPPNAMLDNILTLAGKHQIEVYIGLMYDPNYWQYIQDNPEVIEVYLKKQLIQQKNIAAEIFPLIQHHLAFKGWYISEEIDDKNWTQTHKQSLLLSYISDLSQHLSKMASGKNISISAFTNGFMDPITFEDFWQNLLGKSQIDLLFFQDGIGADKTDFKFLSLYYQAIQQACVTHNTTLSIVVELFEVQPQASEFTAIPASIERIKQQLHNAAPYAPNHITAFSVSDYMHNLSPGPAAKLYNQYLSEIMNVLE